MFELNLDTIKVFGIFHPGSIDFAINGFPQASFVPVAPFPINQLLWPYVPGNSFDSTVCVKPRTVAAILQEF